MVFTPRKRAAPTTAFHNTWNETDATFLDPNALPVSKIPRGWERKQEVKRVGEGKEKKIWRRFNLRSRADDTTQEAQDEEEQDARSRPVKRRQQMSPRAMEKSTSKLGGKKRAFKATRWDRRKSVLPRKRATQIEDPVTGEVDSEEEEDITHNMEGEESVNATRADIIEQPEIIRDLSSAQEDSPSFTFTTNAPMAELPERDSIDQEQEEQLESTQDATLAKLFRSPPQQISNLSNASPEKVEYPALPPSDSIEAETEAVTTETASTEETSKVIQETITEEFISVSGGSQEVVREEAELASEEAETIAELQYPALPLDQTTTSPRVLNQKLGDDDDDAELSEVELDISTGGAQEEDVSSSPSAGDREEEFTEASLQLNILRDYQEALQEHDLAPTAQLEPVQLDQETDGYIMEHDSGAKEDMTTPELDIENPPLDETLQSTYQSLSGQDLEMADAPAAAPIDIADGLTFSFTPTKLHSPAPRKLHSPPPPPRPESGPDDVTMTVAFDDDTAILKDFLTRAAVSKAEKAAVTTHKRESLQNRRDSDVIRHALASPRKVLEEKDPNSPTKQHNELTLDLSQTLTLAKPTESLPSPTPGTTENETAEENSDRASRRSSRTKKSRLPAPASIGPAPAPAPKINIRRADGNEVVVLKKDDAKVLADMTRNNTRKNKQGAFCVIVRLMKLAMDASSLPPLDDTTKELVVGKNVRWDETLAYYQENPETLANALADAESLATPDELGMPDSTPEPQKRKKEKTSKASTPKVRRVRGLGSTNGTPGKVLLAPSSLLPEAVQEEKAAAQEKQVSKTKATKVKKMAVASSSSSSSSTGTPTPTSTSTSLQSSLSSSTTDTKLPSLDVAPVGVQRKSRLAAPKKVVLPSTPSSSTTSSSAKVGDKENAARTGISDATPKKGLSAPKVVVPQSAGIESGLPRRRGRKY